MADESTTREFTVYVYGDEGPPDVGPEDVRVAVAEGVPAEYTVEVEEQDIS